MHLSYNVFDQTIPMSLIVPSFCSEYLKVSEIMKLLQNQI